MSHSIIHGRWLFLTQFLFNATQRKFIPCFEHNRIQKCMPPTPLKNRPQTARLNSWQKSVTKQSTIRKIYITSVDKQTEDHPNMAEFSRTPKTAEIFRNFPTSLTLPCSHSARGNSPKPSGRRAPTLILSFFTRALSVTNSDAKRNRNQNKYGARRKHGFPPTAKKRKSWQPTVSVLLFTFSGTELAGPA